TLSILSRMTPPLPATLFPYTTLFRSRRGRETHSYDEQLLDSRAERKREGGLERARDHRAWEGRGENYGARQGSTGEHGPSHRRRSEEHTSELQSRSDLVCRLLLEKKN